MNTKTQAQKGFKTFMGEKITEKVNFRGKYLTYRELGPKDFLKPPRQEQILSILDELVRATEMVESKQDAKPV